MWKFLWWLWVRLIAGFRFFSGLQSVQPFCCLSRLPQSAPKWTSIPYLCLLSHLLLLPPTSLVAFMIGLVSLTWSRGGFHKKISVSRESPTHMCDWMVSWRFCIAATSFPSPSGCSASNLLNWALITTSLSHKWLLTGQSRSRSWRLLTLNSQQKDGLPLQGILSGNQIFVLLLNLKCGWLRWMFSRRTSIPWCHLERDGFASGWTGSGSWYCIKCDGWILELSYEFLAFLGSLWVLILDFFSPLSVSV